MLNTRERNLRHIGIGVLASGNFKYSERERGGGVDSRLDPVLRCNCKDRATLPSHIGRQADLCACSPISIISNLWEYSCGY
jgi:hypothetical protein